MSYEVEVVVVKTANGPVRVNKADYEADPKAWGTLDKAGTEDAAGAGPLPSAGTTTPNAPAQYFVNKEGRKYFVHNLTGEKATVDGIDQDGYKTEDDARAAIDALKPKD